MIVRRGSSPLGRLAASVVTAAALASIAVAAEPPEPRPATAKERKTIGTWIEQETKKLRRTTSGDLPTEFAEGRLFVTGAVGADGHDDVAAQYTIERGNDWDIYLAVFRRDSMKLVARGRIGGRSYRAIEIRGVEDGVVIADTDNYEYSDAMCCPSVPGTTTFSIDGGMLEEHDARFDCSEPGEDPPDPSSRV